MKDLIFELGRLRGISGFEYRINEDIKKLFDECSDETEIDALGSVIAVKRSHKQGAKKIVIEAHIDEIGLIVKSIEENGFITIAAVGGVDSRILPASEVIIHGKRDVKGVIGAKPPHIMAKGEEEKCAKISDMAIDTGLTYDEVCQNIKVGNPVTFAVEPKELSDGQITGKSLDDRASVAVLLDVMKNLKSEEINADVYAVLSAQEEVGGFGAMTAAYKIAPDLAIAVDVCHGITPDNSFSAYEIGSGAVVTCGPNIHPAIFNRLMDTAKKHNIKTAIDVDGGNTGTDAWEMQVLREGIPTGLLSIPLKYMHTSVETIAVSDAEAVSRLIQSFILELDGKEEWLCY